jgi:hypothetical protein
MQPCALKQIRGMAIPLGVCVECLRKHGFEIDDSISEPERLHCVAA